MESKQKAAKDTKSSIASNTKHFWHILRAIYYMLQNNITKNNLLIDIKLKLHHRLDSLSCKSMDPTAAFFSPREIEFSCSNTPSHSFLHLVNNINKRKHRKRFHVDVEEIARAFELLDNSEIPIWTTATPSPVALWMYAKSPMVVRQLRVTDSPFPMREEEEEGGREVDREAEEFIRRFYQQLRLQPIG